ncbi:MAG: glycosyltransferase family 39 protein [Chloroflexota bacterium]
MRQIVFTVQSLLHRFGILSFVLFGFGLLTWQLDLRGLAYDESGTALMARATPLEILHFHWNAAFEHPPLWQLLVHAWSLVMGQSEIALRLLPVFASVLAIALLWSLLNYIWPTQSGIRIMATLLAVTSPILLQYSQTARMYTVVLMLSLLSLYACIRLIDRPTRGIFAVYVLANWLMTGTHYYSALLIVAQAIFLGGILLQRQTGWLVYVSAVLLSTLPLLLWIGFSPGFQQTLTVILDSNAGQTSHWATHLLRTWAELLFGNTNQHEPYVIHTGWLALIILSGFLSSILFRRKKQHESTQWQWLLLMCLCIPLGLSILFAANFKTRYILFAAPSLWILYAVSVDQLGRLWRRLTIMGLLPILVFAGLGIEQYFRPYISIGYRELAADLLREANPQEDVVILEAPRQHLLTKYYLQTNASIDLAIHPVPHVELPDYWPVNAPLIDPFETDDYVQAWLQQYQRLWVIFTGEAEVDPSEFLQKYLVAVSFGEECRPYPKVRLCRFVSPQWVSSDVEQNIDVIYGDELRLQRATIALSPREDASSTRYLRATLYWEAVQKPTRDYKVSLRLVDAQGIAVSQIDDYPIGTLLPPTTWNAGDEKPGYMVLPLAVDLVDGDYGLMAHVYDSVTGESFGASQMLTIISVTETVLQLSLEK